MEPDHRSKIKEIYRHQVLPSIIILDIPDGYEYLDEELIAILDAKINNILRSNYNI